MNPRIQHQLLIPVKWHVKLTLEFPLVVLNPAVSVLVLDVRTGIIPIFKQRIGESKSHAYHKIRPSARVQRIVDGTAPELYGKRQIVGIAVLDNIIRPILQHVTLVRYFRVHREVIIRPFDTPSQTKTDTESGHQLVRILIAVRIISSIIRFVIILGIPGLAGIIGGETQGIRLLPTQPRFSERQAERSIIFTVGLRLDAQRLPVTLGQGTVGFPIENIPDGKV